MAAAPGRELESEAHAALHAHASVDRALRGDLVRRPLAQEAALPGVGPLGVLPHHGEVRPLGDRARDTGEWAQVHVQVELEAEAEQQAALEGARRDSGVADRRPDGPEEDGVEAAQLGQGLVG